MPATKKAAKRKKSTAAHLPALPTIPFMSLGAYVQEHKTQLVIVDLSAEWCYACKEQVAVLRKVISQLNPEKAVFVGVDIDENNDLADEMGIDAVPTLMFWLNGVPQTHATVVGTISEKRLLKKIGELLPEALTA